MATEGTRKATVEIGLWHLDHGRGEVLLRGYEDARRKLNGDCILIHSEVDRVAGTMQMVFEHVPVAPLDITTTRVYIASHDRGLALAAAEEITVAGLQLSCSWITAPMNATSTYSDADKQQIADQDEWDIAQANVLILLAGSEKYSGGKFVEAGIARGKGARVIIVGRRENMLLWATGYERYDTVAEAIEAIVRGC